MTRLPQDDDRELIDFLKLNRPFTPEEKVNLEEELIDLVKQENLYESPKPLAPLVWLFPGIFVVGALFAINSESLSYKFTLREFRIMPPSGDRNEELEEFLVNNWQDTIYNYQTIETEQVSTQNIDLSIAVVK